MAIFESWLSSKPDKTVIAVLASGYVPHDAENKCDCLNAILAGGIIPNSDFQSNRECNSDGPFVGGASPASSLKPFVGVASQSLNGASNRDLHASNQVGVFDDEVRLSVMAFLA